MSFPFFDDLTQEAGVEATFAAGDTMSATAGPPTVSETPTTVTLFVDGVIANTAAFPGTVEYVFPAAGLHDLAWLVAPGAATWSVSCSAADPAEEIAELRLAGLGIHHVIASALDRRLRAALDALAANDTAGACAMLQAFLSQVSAPTWNLLSTAHAQQLADAANDIRATLGC